MGRQGVFLSPLSSSLILLSLPIEGSCQWSSIFSNVDFSAIYAVNITLFLALCNFWLLNGLRYRVSFM